MGFLEMCASTAGLLMVLPAARAATYASAGGSGTCATDGSSYSYVETVSSTTRTIVTNVCPNHPYYVLNPNTPYGTSQTFLVPLKPVIANSYLTASTGQTNLAAQGGGVGILFSGAYVFSAYGGPQYGTLSSWSNSAPYAEGYTFDQCGCHASSSTGASYHCHVPPSCLLQQLGQSTSAHSPQIGWMADGFPLYGPRGKDGTLLQSCTLASKTYGTSSVCVDGCNGAGSANGGSDWVSDGYTYRYYILGNYDDGKQCKVRFGDESALESAYIRSPSLLRRDGNFLAGAHGVRHLLRSVLPIHTGMPPRLRLGVWSGHVRRLLWNHHSRHIFVLLIRCQVSAV
jgi:hypothetical protein